MTTCTSQILFMSENLVNIIHAHYFVRFSHSNEKNSSKAYSSLVVWLSPCACAKPYDEGSLPWQTLSISITFWRTYSVWKGVDGFWIKFNNPVEYSRAKTAIWEIQRRLQKNIIPDWSHCARSKRIFLKTVYSFSCLHELLVGKNPSLVGHLIFQPQLIETENRKMPEWYHCARRALKSPCFCW